jgi:hypothetical protein
MKQGIWEGFFTVNGKRVLFEASVVVESAGGIENFRADGADSEADFVLSGTVEGKAPFRVEAQRNAVTGGERFRCEGFAEKSRLSMFGEYKVNDKKAGEWSMKFVPDKVVSSFREKRRAALYGQLCEMGYEEWLIEDALQATGCASLKNALDYIHNQQELTANQERKRAAAFEAGDNDNNNNSNLGGGGGGAKANSGGSGGADALEAKIDELIAMGFDRERSKQALSVMDGDVEKAVEFLFQQSN